MAHVVPLLVAFGKRGPRWLRLSIPWTLISFSFLALGHTLHHGQPSTALWSEYERIALWGSLGIVVIRSEMIARLLRALCWPTYSERLSSEIMVQLSIYCLTYTSLAMILTVILGCLATHAPFVAAFRFPFRHVSMDFEMFEGLVIRNLLRSEHPLDRRIAPFVLDGVTGAMVVSLAPIAGYLGALYLKYAFLGLLVRIAVRRQRRMHRNVVDAVSKLLDHEMGGPVQTLTAVKPDILKESLERAVRKRLKTEMDGYSRLLAVELAEAFQTEIVEKRQTPLDKRLRFLIKPGFKLTWAIIDEPHPPAADGL